MHRGGASENTFKHINDRHPFYYHPGFMVELSEMLDITNSDIKDLSFTISKLRKDLAKLFIKLAKDELPEEIDVSKLENYRSFQRIDNESKTF